VIRGSLSRIETESIEGHAGDMVSRQPILVGANVNDGPEHLGIAPVARCR
jgi:hypothetical protein